MPKDLNVPQQQFEKKRGGAGGKKVLQTPQIGKLNFDHSGKFRLHKKLRRQLEFKKILNVPD